MDDASPIWTLAATSRCRSPERPSNRCRGVETTRSSGAEVKCLLGERVSPTGNGEITLRTSTRHRGQVASAVPSAARGRRGSGPPGRPPARAGQMAIAASRGSGDRCASPPKRPPRRQRARASSSQRWLWHGAKRERAVRAARSEIRELSNRRARTGFDHRAGRSGVPGARGSPQHANDRADRRAVGVGVPTGLDVRPMLRSRSPSPQKARRDDRWKLLVLCFGVLKTGRTFRCGDSDGRLS